MKDVKITSLSGDILTFEGALDVTESEGFVKVKTNFSACSTRTEWIPKTQVGKVVITEYLK